MSKHLTNLQRQKLGEVLKLYYSQEYTIEEIAKKLDLGHTTVWRWINIFADEKQIINTAMPKNNPSIEAKETQEYQAPESLRPSSDEKQLLAEIERLKAELAGAQLKAEAYNRMIDIAEEQFKIQIRKKHGAKQ